MRKAKSLFGSAVRPPTRRGNGRPLPAVGNQFRMAVEVDRVIAFGVVIVGVRRGIAASVTRVRAVPSEGTALDEQHSLGRNVRLLRRIVQVFERTVWIPHV